MKKDGLRKGGVETIVGVIVLVGIVVALLIAVVIPMIADTQGTGELTNAANEKVSTDVNKIIDKSGANVKGKSGS